VRGQPSVGLDFSQDLSSGLSDHFGVNEGLGALILSKNFTVLNVATAAWQTAQSNDFQIRLPTVVDIAVCVSSVVCWFSPQRPLGSAAK